ncbi:Fur-regulated basic protein FbpA [Bacillus sp. CGMCC 1.16607]|uniref:Fur-regulated basic protein FbpA n=1 Tax=Bacillus sp. CGMCC 1.16607 TaxID=3351842 RepID=UPI003633FDD3
MSNELRKAIEKAKKYYKQKLVDAGVYKSTDPELHGLTLSDMIQLYQKHKASK